MMFLHPESPEGLFPDRYSVGSDLQGLINQISFPVCTQLEAAPGDDWARFVQALSRWQGYLARSPDLRDITSLLYMAQTLDSAYKQRTRERVCLLLGIFEGFTL